ncbi:MAG: hypothetical protein ACJAW4_003574 [Paracoccaceae bacterium]
MGIHFVQTACPPLVSLRMPFLRRRRSIDHIKFWPRLMGAASCENPFAHALSFKRPP